MFAGPNLIGFLNYREVALRNSKPTTSYLIKFPNSSLLRLCKLIGHLLIENLLVDLISYEVCFGFVCSLRRSYTSATMDDCMLKVLTVIKWSGPVNYFAKCFAFSAFTDRFSLYSPSVIFLKKRGIFCFWITRFPATNNGYSSKNPTSAI
jgi:hypothetical protein